MSEILIWNWTGLRARGRGGRERYLHRHFFIFFFRTILCSRSVGWVGAMARLQGVDGYGGHGCCCGCIYLFIETTPQRRRSAAKHPGKVDVKT